MGRPLRVTPAGYPVHVVHRGNNRMAIFRAESDYRYMRHCLEEGMAGRGIALHAYVLMTNHLHLLVSAADETGVSRFIQSAACRYVRYFNRKYERTGTLWEGRFHSAVVTTDHYVLACHRYIDLNPVRAGVEASVEAYPWSSHRHYAFDTADALLTAHPVIVALAQDAARRRPAYRNLFANEMEPWELDAIRFATLRRRPLGARELRGAGIRGRPRKLVSDTIYAGGQGTARSCEPG